MEPMQEMAKLYLDWWEQYWEQAYASTPTLEDMHSYWSAMTQSYEELLKTA